MKITDGKKTVDVKMKTWDGCQCTPDWAEDFFCAGSLPYDDEADVFTVPDVDACIEQAEDWRDCRGDFQDDAEYLREDEERIVILTTGF